MSRKTFDSPSLLGARPGFLGNIGPRKFRTKMLFLFGVLMAGYVGLSYVVLGRPAALLFLSGAFFVLGILCVILLSGMITRPLVQLTRTAERWPAATSSSGPAFSPGTRPGFWPGRSTACSTHWRSLSGISRAATASSKRASSAPARWTRTPLSASVSKKELRLARIEIDHLVDKRTEELARANDELHGKVLETRRSEDYLQARSTAWSGPWRDFPGHVDDPRDEGSLHGRPPASRLLPGPWPSPRR